MESAQADVIKMETPDEEASMAEAEIKQELMDLDLIIQRSDIFCHDTNSSSVELKLKNESPEQKTLESKDNITSLDNHVVEPSGADSSNNPFELLIESSSGDHKLLVETKESLVTSGIECSLSGSTETFNGLQVISEELKQESSCTKRKNLLIEDEPEVKYVNTQDYLDIGETVITAPGETLPKKQNSAAKQITPNPVKSCSESKEVVPCAGVESAYSETIEVVTSAGLKYACSEIIEVVPCSGLKCALQLLERGKFHTLSPFEKAELITAPRPTPDLDMSDKRPQRQFNRSIYKTPWVAGCSHVNKFFCWSCLLLSASSSSWTTGYDNLSNIYIAIKRHQTSQKHLNSVISFHNFAKQLSLPSITRQTCDEIIRYNTRVDFNRSVFKRLVDVVCHLAQLDLPFRSQDESDTSLNKGNFLELVILLSKYDHVLAKQIQESGSSYITEKMQNDIIRSVSDVVKARIEAEIRQSQFISVIVDETPGADNIDQLFIIFRYFFEDNINERFMGFINCPNCTVYEVSQTVLGMIKKYECEKKIIAQSYDGTSITAAVKKGVHSTIKKVIPQAIYIWCDPHTFDMVLSKSCSRIGDVNYFFFSLFSLVNFFSNNVKRQLYYDKFCKKRLPDISPTNRWSYLSCIVRTVHEQKKNIRKLFTKITDEPENWDGDTNLSADNLLNLVTSFKFHFYLEVFLAIFLKTNSINCIKQKSQVHLLHLTPKIDELKDWLFNFKSHFNFLYKKALQDNSPPPSSRSFPCASTRYNQIFIKIIENVSAEINDRLQDISNLRFLRLLNENRFDQHAINFPENEFDTVGKGFGNHFDTEALKNQLMCIYSVEEVIGFNLLQLIDFIEKSPFNNTFSDLSKLTHLVATIPGTSLADSEFSNLNKRVHAHLRNAQGEDRLADLATIAIEKELLLNLRCSNTFYDDVIKSFSSKGQYLELEYK